MEPNLLVGDRLFVTKYSYGYSKHSFPFSPPIFKGRILPNDPERGDVVVFKTPADNRTDYIKRLIGKPGDRIQFVNSNLYLNNSEVIKSMISRKDKVFVVTKLLMSSLLKSLFLLVKNLKTVYLKNYSYQDSDLFIVPEDHYFFLGDNRDCSKIVGFYPALDMYTRIFSWKSQFIFFFR